MPTLLENSPYLNTDVKKYTLPTDTMVNNLLKLPNAQEKVYQTNEDFEKELTDLTIDTQKELNALKNIIEKNLNSKFGLSLRSNTSIDFLSNEGIFQNLSNDIKLEEIFILGQKFSVYDPETDEQRNVVYQKGKDGKMSYVYENTNVEVIISNGMVLKQYDKNINYVEIRNEKKGFKPPILSVPAYKSSTGVTLCSRTARENLSKLGIKNPKQGASAKDSFNMYTEKAVEFPPKDGNATLVDLYCDASPKNAKYGHRSVGIKIDGAWYVLDPYYGGGSRNPMPTDKYISMMKQKGRKFWGGHILS